jgi:hypothetical protein
MSMTKATPKERMIKAWADVAISCRKQDIGDHSPRLVQDDRKLDVSLRAKRCARTLHDISDKSDFTLLTWLAWHEAQAQLLRIEQSEVAAAGWRKAGAK